MSSEDQEQQQQQNILSQDKSNDEIQNQQVVSEQNQQTEEEFKINRVSEGEEKQVEEPKDKLEDNEQKEEEQNENEQSNDGELNENNQDEDENDFDKDIPESEKSLEKTQELKEKGNKFFYEQLFDDAIEYYEQAAKYCPSNETKQLSVLHSNLAICYLRKSDYESVIEYSTESIKLDPTFKKPYLNRVTAFEKTEKLEEAIEDLKTLEKLDPSDKTFKAKIFVLEKDLEKLNEKRKTEVLSGLKDLGNTILGKFGLSLDNFKLGQNANGSYNINFSK